MMRSTWRLLAVALATLIGAAAAAAPVAITWSVAPTQPDENRLRNADFAQRDNAGPVQWEFTTAIPDNFEVGWSEVGRSAPGSARINTLTGSMSGYWTQTVPVTEGERLLVLAHVRLVGGTVLLWLTGSPLMADGTRGRFDERFELPSMKSFFLAPTWIDPRYLRGPDSERWVPLLRAIDIPAMEALRVGIGSYFQRGEMWIDDAYAGPAQVDLTIDLSARDGGRITSVEVVAVPDRTLASEAIEQGVERWTYTARGIDPEQGIVVRGTMVDGEQFARRIFPPQSGRWED
ncbi:MAG: hypothetical protein AB7Y46_16210 [Armatimonadota bacterium]